MRNFSHFKRSRAISLNARLPFSIGDWNSIKSIKLQSFKAASKHRPHSVGRHLQAMKENLKNLYHASMNKRSERMLRTVKKWRFCSIFPMLYNFYGRSIGATDSVVSHSIHALDGFSRFVILPRILVDNPILTTTSFYSTDVLWPFKRSNLDALQIDVNDLNFRQFVVWLPGRC